MLTAANSLPGGWLESGHGSIALYVQDFRDPLARKKKLILRPWASVKDIKDQLQVVFNVPSHVQRLYFQGRELKNHHNLQECGIYQDHAIIDFVARRAPNLAMLFGSELEEAAAATTTNGATNAIFASSGRSASARLGASVSAAMTKTTTTTGATSGPTKAPPSSSSSRAGANSGSSPSVRPRLLPVISIHPFGAHLLPVALMKIMHQALQGLALGLAPVLAMDGTGGTYFLKDPAHRNVGCFKPQDEEPFGPNNPRGLEGELGQSGLRRGILSGEACERELAAYMLDRDHFAGVPATSLVEARHPVFKYKELTKLHFKMGSLQEFVRHDDVASDIAPSQFPTHQVHKVVLLDMRLLNTDRNDANILVRKRRTSTTSPQVEYELIPIDHGYCLPQFLEIAWCDWCWYNWPQLHEPLSTADRDYILGINPQEEAERLSKKIPLRRACRRNMIIAGMLVYKGVKANLVLYEIAKIMCRDDLDSPSTLERLCIDAFHLLKQKKADQTASVSISSSFVSASSSPEAGLGPGNSTQVTIPNGKSSTPPKPPTLRLSIDTSTVDSDSFGNGTSPSRSGARSPPGFWASFTPFSGRDWADDVDDDDDNDDPSARPFLKWDAMAATALGEAAQKVDGGNVHVGPPKHHASDDQDDRGSVMSTAFPGDADKDEFEVMNEVLDDNQQDEKLFLGILGRLMDEKIDECARSQHCQKSNRARMER